MTVMGSAGSDRKIPSFVSDAKTALEAACRGALSLHPALLLHSDQRVVYRHAGDRHRRVTLVSGGGSGHEPAHIGYVGTGMLDAAVCGAVFASPNALGIETGLRLVDSPKGILVVIKNYTGDKLNFSLAAERYRFASGTPVRLIVVADDVSIGRTRSALVGRRGLAGTVLVHKIAGGAAAAGLDLETVAEAAEFAVRHMGTIGVGLDSCDLPGQSHVSRLKPDEIELGIGIHNEPGSRRISPQPSVEVLVRDMLKAILDETDAERNYLAPIPPAEQSDVVLLVNNLGSLSILELMALSAEVISQLQSSYQIRPARVYAGTFLTALNGPGFSVTLMRLPKDSPLSATILQWLDAPTDALGWTCSISPQAWNQRAEQQEERPHGNGVHDTKPKAYTVPKVPCNPTLFSSIIRSVHASVVAAEPEITRLDTILGDGDCGTTLLSGVRAVADALSSPDSIDPSNLSEGLVAVADTISRSMGGTSGALYAVFFTALASAICTTNLRHHHHQEDTPAPVVDLPALASALHTALAKLQTVTAARVGDRTMMDALIPFVTTLLLHAARRDQQPQQPPQQQQPHQLGPLDLEALEEAVRAAKAGCESTRDVGSKFGRSTYVDADAAGYGDEGEAVGPGLPDAGACGVVAVLEGVLGAVREWEGDNGDT